MASNTPREIPSPIKRAVRQRCGFGCVVCGLPLYEYEHMEGWANVGRHVAQEITLLCDRHHRERTNGLLPISAVRDANDTPFNLRQGASTAYQLHYSGTSSSVVLGNVVFEAALVDGLRGLAPVVIDGEEVVSFRLEDGHVLLTMTIHDAYSRLVLSIVDNELRHMVGNAWDFQMVGRRLTIRMGPSRIFLELEFAVPSELIVRRGFFLRNGVQINIDAQGMAIANTGTVWSQCAFTDFNAGIVIGEISPGCVSAFHFSHVKRYGWQSAGIFALEA